MAVKYCSIKKRTDFISLFTKSKTIPGKLVFFRARKNSLDSTRFCIVVSSKISKKATARNKIRRKIKEIIKKAYPGLKPGFDVAITAKSAILDKKFSTIQKEIIKLFKEAGILK